MQLKGISYILEKKYKKSYILYYCTIDGHISFLENLVNFPTANLIWISYNEITNKPKGDMILDAEVGE